MISRIIATSFVIVVFLALIAMPVGSAQAESSIADYVVISEIQIDSIDGSGGASDDWIELYNPTSSDIDLSAGYRLERATASGGDPSVLLQYGSADHGASYPGGVIIPAQGFYLHVSNSASESLQDMADALSDFALTDDNVLYLATGAVGAPSGTENNDPDIVDYVGYGSALQYEGTGPAPAPPAGGSIERRTNGGIDHDYGNAWDTNNNDDDFVAQSTENPRNSTSQPPVPPVPELPSVLLFCTGLLGILSISLVVQRRFRHAPRVQ